MPRTIDPYLFDRAIKLADAVGDLIQKAAAANLPSVQQDVNSLVQDMVAYAKELLDTPRESGDEPATTDAAPAE